MIRILVAVLISIVMFSSVAVSQTSGEAISLDKVFCYRQVDKQGNNLTVTILINTKGLEREKTLKLKEKFPTGFQAKVTKSYGSSATVTETAILFIWSNLPPSDLFAVSYELTSATPLNESVLINGNMSFLSETGIKYVSINQRDFLNDKDIASRIKNLPPYNPPAAGVTTASTLTPEIKPISKAPDTVAPPKPKPRTNYKEEPVKTTVAETKPVTPVEPVQKQEPIKETAQNVENNQTETKPVSPVEPIKETPQNIETKPVTPVEPVKKQEPVKPTVSENNNITEVKPVSTVKPVKKETKPVPTHTEEATNISGVYYTVQIGATPKKLPSNYFAKYNFNKTVDENSIDGMYKYSLGQFPTLKEATNYQNYVKQKNVQCFIVAYSNGKKLTIKEALAVSKN